MTPVFDLASLDTAKKANEGVWMPVIHPKTKLPTGLRILLFGMDSEIQQKYQRDYMDRMVQRKADAPAPDQAEEELEMLATCTGGWDMNGSPLVLEGKELPFTHENAKAVYKRFAWIKGDVDRFVGNRGNFLPE